MTQLISYQGQCPHPNCHRIACQIVAAVVSSHRSHWMLILWQLLQGLLSPRGDSRIVAI
jgi:hypothetical protein